MRPTLFTPSPRWGTGHRGGTWIPETSAQDSTSELQSAMPADSFVTTWGSNTKFTCKTLRSLPLLQHDCSYYHSTFQEFWWPKVCMFQNSLRTVLEIFVLPKQYCSQQISNLNLQAFPHALVPFPTKPNNRERQNGNLLAWEHLQVVDIVICWRGSTCKLLILSFVGGGALASCWYCHFKVTSEVPKFLLSLKTNIKNCGDTSVTKLRQAHTNLTPPKIIRHSACTLWWSLYAYFVPVWHDAATP
jgi:hypothetical protein